MSIFSSLQQRLRWQRGRQGNNNQAYYKLKIFVSKRLKMDCWLLRYPNTVGLTEHTDPVDKNHEHHRINIVLVAPKAGGEFICENAALNTRFVKYFRPDIHPHSVTAGTGTRIVLSIGWKRRKDKNEKV